jgi:DNA-binding GntR family transcriptional regulator
VTYAITTGDPGQPDPRRYVQLAAVLRWQIATGSLAAGDPVPSITTLAGELGYGRQTCGKAMQVLEREGLLARFPGVGYYVTGPAAASAGPDGEAGDEDVRLPAAPGHSTGNEDDDRI